MSRLLLTPALLVALFAPALAGDAPPAAPPAAAATTEAPVATAPCECGGPGRCCGGQAAATAPATPEEKAASGRPCGCARARQAAEKARQ